jgi:hypothetical protein
VNAAALAEGSPAITFSAGSGGFAGSKAYNVVSHGRRAVARGLPKKSARPFANLKQHSVL